MRGAAKALSVGAAALLATACGRHEADDAVGKTFRVDGHLALEVRNLSGPTCVSQGVDGRAVVLARVRGFGWDDHDASEALKKGLEHVSMKQDGPKLVLGLDGLHGDVEVEWKVVVPKDTEVDASNVSGHTCTEGVAGPVRIDSMSGSVEVRDVARDVHVSTVSGDLVVDGADLAEASTMSGTVTVDHVHGDVRVDTVSGDADLGRIGRVAHVGTTSGNISIDSEIADDGLWELSTTSGDVAVQVPREAKARFELRTTSGELDADEARSASRRGADDAVELGDDPRALVSVHTTSGSLHVRAK